MTDFQLNTVSFDQLYRLAACVMPTSQPVGPRAGRLGERWQLISRLLIQLARILNHKLSPACVQGMRVN